jgi:AcrR family transcriptional regulator
MPKETFNKLSKSKQEAIKKAFYREFSLKTFDDASITQVVKQLEIAKGSIYQYFENKLDLYLYLMQEAGTFKVNYLEEVSRENFDNFWEYMREVYVMGIAFDKEYYLESHFLHSLTNNFNSPSIKNMFDAWLKAFEKDFAKKVQYEIDIGLFHNELPADKMGFILHQSIININNYMRHFHALDIEKSINQSQGVFSGEMGNKLLESVDEHFILLQKAFNKKP